MIKGSLVGLRKGWSRVVARCGETSLLWLLLLRLLFTKVARVLMETVTDKHGALWLWKTEMRLMDGLLATGEFDRVTTEGRWVLVM